MSFRFVPTENWFKIPLIFMIFINYKLIIGHTTKAATQYFLNKLIYYIYFFKKKVPNNVHVSVYAGYICAGHVVMVP